MVYRLHLKNKYERAQLLTSPINNNLPRGNDIYSLHFAGSDTSNQKNTQSKTSLFGDDGFTFGDIIDIVNPLQHIPIISNIYRSLSGDTIAPLMQIAGGALYGGPIGAVASLITTAIEEYASDAHSEPDQIGVDPATVAGTYPFQEPDSGTELIQNPEAIPLGMHYGDGIFNPATTNNDPRTFARVKVGKPDVLYAGIDAVTKRSGPLSSSWFINKTYNGPGSVVNNQPHIDITLGENSG